MSDPKVIKLAGELDLAAAPAVKAELMGAVDAGHRQLIVDLTDVEYLDSSTLGALVAAVKRLRPDGNLVVVCPDERLWTIFEATGLDAVLTLVRGQDEIAGHLATD